MNSINQRLSSHGRFGLILVVIGLLLAIDSILKLSLIYKLWPVLITIVGVGFIGIFKQRDRKEPLYLSVGIYFIGFSFLALYCNVTSWSVLSTLWPLFIAILGIALIGSFIFCRHRRMQLLLGLLLISLSTVFFFVFTLDSRLWWTGFILGGISILASELAK